LACGIMVAQCRPIAILQCEWRGDAQLAAFTHTCFGVTSVESTSTRRSGESARRRFSGRKKEHLFSLTKPAPSSPRRGADGASCRPSASRLFSFTVRIFMTTADGAWRSTGKNIHKGRLRPFPRRHFPAPFPDAYRGAAREEPRRARVDVKSSVEPSRRARIIIEPLQGEGVFQRCGHSSFRLELVALCIGRGIVFIAARANTASARTGRMSRSTHAASSPNLITLPRVRRRNSRSHASRSPPQHGPRIARRPWRHILCSSVSCAAAARRSPTYSTGDNGFARAEKRRLVRAALR